MDVNEFNEDFLNPLLEKLASMNKSVYLMGDFNIDLMKIDRDSPSADFFDDITSNLFVPHIIHPTRITSTTKTLIDNIISNSPNFSEGISGNLTLAISDHLAQFLIIPQESDKTPKNKIIYKRDSKNFDRENFLLDALSIDWDKVTAINKGDPNDSFNRFDSTINPLIDKYLPLKKLSRKETKNVFKPWITVGIRNSIKRRDSLHKKYIIAKNIEIKNKYFVEYKVLRNKIVTLCRVSKKAYYTKYFKDNANNIKNTWNGINQIINIKGKRSNQVLSILSKNELITDPKLIANSFNEYFCTIAQKLQSKIYHSNQNFNKYLGNNNNHNFFMSPTDSSELITIIDSFGSNKASGPHSIPYEILHIIKLIIADPLAKIINLSFEKGIYFDTLKISKTIPLFKEKGSYLDCTNYRPISLLSNINKIFEKLMHKRLYNFLSIHNCIYDNQFGFRKKHSTNHALISITEDVRNALDNHKISCGIFIDLQKAFDTVDHHILLSKLEHYGIRGVANDWFRSYLTNRRQFVEINGVNSDELVLPYGVPQGSVLGPLLFLIYINDLHKSIKYSRVRHFADDTNLIISNNSPKQLQKQLNADLKNLCNWLKANKISLNASKSELLIFRHPSKKINYDFKIKIDGKKLIPSTFVKYLGVLIDPHLNWSFHANALSVKLSRAIGLLTKIRHYVSSDVLRNIYHGIFSSLLTYGCQVWGQVRNKYICRLERLQNNAIKVINFANFRESSLPFYKESNILKLNDVIKIQNFLFVLDDIKGELPRALSNTFQLTCNKHKYNTRSAARFTVNIPKVNSTLFGLRSINFQSSQIWNFFVNKFPDLKFKEKSKSICKKKLFSYFVESYQI